MRDFELSVVNGGIQRLRTKGGANQKSLYDLVNGYVTADRHVKARPGTFRTANLPAGTVGLTAFDGVLNVFSHDFVEDIPDGYRLHVLRHPQIVDSAGDEITIAKIHFAEPFLGFLYVVAEFAIPEDDADTFESVYHYWLQRGDAWEATTWYPLGSVVSPTDDNGLAYQSTRLGAAFPSWAAGTPRTEGDIIEPTVYNDFYYTATAVAGANPVSGSIEPEWPTDPGANIVEESEGENTVQVGPAVTQPDETQQPNPVTVDRYDLLIRTRPTFFGRVS